MPAVHTNISSRAVRAKLPATVEASACRGDVSHRINRDASAVGASVPAVHATTNSSSDVLGMASHESAPDRADAASFHSEISCAHSAHSARCCSTSRNSPSIRAPSRYSENLSCVSLHFIFHRFLPAAGEHLPGFVKSGAHRSDRYAQYLGNLGIIEILFTSERQRHSKPLRQ